MERGRRSKGTTSDFVNFATLSFGIGTKFRKYVKLKMPLFIFRGP